MFKKQSIQLLTLLIILSLFVPSVFAMNTFSTSEDVVGQRALEHIEYLSKVVGTRIAGTDSEAAGKDYVAEVFNSIGYETIVQAFSYVRSNRTNYSNNVIAVKEGKSSKQVIVGAHYDSVSAGTGADDNASGVAVMLEVAEMLKDIDTTYTIKFIAFGAEEVGLKGARHYVNSMSEQEIANTIAMINLDSVLSGDIMYVYNGMEQNTWVREQAQEIAATLGLNVQTNPGLNPNYPKGTAGDWSDHVPFRQVGIPIAYFEATNWEIGDFDGYLQTEKYGMIMHTWRDNLDVIMTEFPGRVEERLDTFTTLLYHLLLEITPPAEQPPVEKRGVLVAKETWHPNANIPFKFTTLNRDGEFAAMEEVTVRIFSRNNEIATYREGKGADNVRQSGKIGDYLVNLNTRALGLKEGTYIVLIEFTDDNERIIYSTIFDLE